MNEFLKFFLAVGLGHGSQVRVDAWTIGDERWVNVIVMVATVEVKSDVELRMVENVIGIIIIHDGNQYHHYQKRVIVFLLFVFSRSYLFNDGFAWRVVL